MHLFVIDHPYHYEAENLCRVFPFDPVVTLHSAEAEAPQPRAVYTAVADGRIPSAFRTKAARRRAPRRRAGGRIRPDGAAF